MEHFKAVATARYQPEVSFRTTPEADAIVRTTTSHPDLPSLLKPNLSLSVSHNASHTTLPWLDASRTLTEALRNPPPKTPSDLVGAYTDALEAVTKVADHDHLSAPVATFICAWVGETDLIKSLKGIEDAARRGLEGTAVSLYRAYVESKPRPPEDGDSPVASHVLLVQRANSRQDDAAQAGALRAAQSVYGESRTHIIAVGAGDGNASPAAVAARVESVARHAIERSIIEVRRDAERLRKARSSFRSWFGGAPPVTPLRNVAYEGGRAGLGESAGGIAGGTGAGGRRRLSIGSGGVQTPLFPVESVESRTAHLADLYVLAGRYGEACETFRLLQNDLRAHSGSALVYEAAAYEMGAMTLALTDGPKQTVGSGIERAIQIYCRAGRQELAVRATLRGAAFCTEAGFPGSAAGVIIRAVDVILPSQVVLFGGSPGVSPTGNSFLDGSLGVLHTSCASAFAALGKVRRSSLHAYLASCRFAKLKLSIAAGCVVKRVDGQALLRPGLRDEVELMLGAAEMAEERHLSAARHFVRVMSMADQHTDVEVQGTAIRGFLEATGTGAKTAMSKRWDTGASFPLVPIDSVSVTTYDSRAEENADWKSLVNDVLADHEYFEALEKTPLDDPLPRRERRLDSIIAELRRKKVDDSADPGGSLEMKIKRIRELADAKAESRRKKSLLDRGAVVGERISISATMKNPLQFPIFVSDLAAVVSMNGQLYSLNARGGKDDSDENETIPISFVSVNALTLVSSSSQTVTVEVIAKKSGVLQVLGLSWRFTVGMGGATLTPGDLTVPGFCVFERRGKRLNMTRRQRASEVPVYQKDVSLIIKVTPPASRVKGVIVSNTARCLEGEPGPVVLRAGETREAKLVLTNEGNVFLKHLDVRVGTPDSIFLDLHGTELNGQQSGAVSAIGMNEEIVNREELRASVRLPVNLTPGGRVEVSVWLRAAVSNSAFGARAGLSANRTRGNKRSKEGGKDEAGTLPCEVRLAIAYGEEATRVSLVSMLFRVRPSVLVSPRFLREADQAFFEGKGRGLRGVILGLEVEHGGQKQSEDLMFQITELSITSKTGWRPMALQGASQVVEDVAGEIEQSATSLRINETATVFCLVVRDGNHSTGVEQDSVVESSPWRTSTIRLSQEPVIQQRHVAKMWDEGSCSSLSEDFLQAERAASTHFVLCASHRSTSTILDKAGKREMVYVAVGWESSSGFRGEIYIPPIDPVRWMKSAALPERVQRSLNTADSSTPRISGNAPEASSLPPEDGNSTQSMESREDWLEVKVHHPSEMTHDFFQKDDGQLQVLGDAHTLLHPLVVPVDVRVKNVCPYLLDVMFEAPVTESIAEGDRGRFWAGDIATSLRALPPNAERIVKLSAVLVGPGRYNLSKFTLVFQSCGYTTLKVRRQAVIPPSYILVNTASVPGVLKRNNGLLPATGASPVPVEDSGATDIPVAQVNDKASPNAPQDTADEAVEVPKVVSNEETGKNSLAEESTAIGQVMKRRKSESLNSEARFDDDRKQDRSPRTRDPLNPVRSKSQPPSERRKSFARARGKSAEAKLFNGSADDALWNASDTDESDE